MENIDQRRECGPDTGSGRVRARPARANVCDVGA